MTEQINLIELLGAQRMLAIVLGTDRDAVLRTALTLADRGSRRSRSR